MARLWNYDEFGEPWLENMPLLIVNRKHHKKGKKMAAVRRRRRRNVKRHHRHHVYRRRLNAPRRVRRYRRRRRNPWPMAGPVAALNPRRRRRGFRNSPKRRRRHHYRRNPKLLGMALPSLESVAYGTLGFVATPMVEGFLNGVLPTTLTTTTLGKYAARIASVMGLTWIAKMVKLGGRANMIAIGGGMYVLTSAVKEFAPLSVKQMLGMSWYAPPTLRAYASPTSGVFNPMPALRGLGAPNYGAQNTPHFAPFGGGRIVAARFRRFQ